MKMRIITPVFLLLFITAGIKSQSLTNAAILSYASTYSSGTIYSNCTVGEVATGTISDNTIMLTQGFQQGFTYISSLEELVNEFNFRLYPNPAKEILTIEWKNTEGNASIYIQINDVNGKTVLMKKTTGTRGSDQILLTDLSTGTYFLLVLNEKNALLGRCAIVKN